jgi:DNA-binding MarR family transcriptional regulator
MPETTTPETTTPKRTRSGVRSPAKLRILAALAARPEPLRPMDVAQITKLDTTSVANHLKDLTKMGLVERTPNPQRKIGSLYALAPTT